MLDRYYLGETKRISPEAPVPVVKVASKKKVLGGAGNVAANLKKLGAKVGLLTTIGKDETAAEITQLIDAQGIEFFPLLSQRPSISKTRILSSSQQMIRLDEEDSSPLNFQEQEQLLEQIEILANYPWDAWVLSDYGKGLCTEAVCQSLIRHAKLKQIPLIIDPKGLDWQRYQGAFMVTPNLRELAEACGRPLANENAFLELAGREIQERFQIENLLVTRSEKGMSLFQGLEQNSSVKHVGTRAQEVFDVSGAGDTVVATLARVLASQTNYDLEQAVELANRAGALVVAHVGTYALSQEELLASLQVDLQKKQEEDFPSILGRSQLKAWKNFCQNSHLKIIFTNGCFDLLHRGHLDYLKRARALGDRLIVGLNSDASVKRLKGVNRPINTEDDRALMLSSLKFVDHVVLFEEDTPFDLIQELRPDILVKGGDYALDDIVGREFATQTLTLPFVEGHSTSSMIKKIHEIFSEEDSGSIVTNPDLYASEEKSSLG
ncbi:MAG: D-glycero-beta-D-manno-heptose 1-phosphate adenylyltransferase [Deltaproteobacteria bacterium]|nr:D-glycero-beta-D-manno-heptose 1-phosphate adenylyltransferase [Deltaproteobacteria bacterium]